MKLISLWKIKSIHFHDKFHPKFYCTRLEKITSTVREATAPQQNKAPLSSPPPVEPLNTILPRDVRRVSRVPSIGLPRWQDAPASRTSVSQIELQKYCRKNCRNTARGTAEMNFFISPTEDIKLCANMDIYTYMNILCINIYIYTSCSIL